MRRRLFYRNGAFLWERVRAREARVGACVSFLVFFRNGSRVEVSLNMK